MKICKLACLVILFYGCASHTARSIKITLKNNSMYIQATGIDAAMFAEMQRDSGSLQTLMPVFRMPRDTDMKDYQRPQPGVYKMEVSAIIFTPDTPFTTGNTYFLRFYDFAPAKTASEIIRSRRKLGSKVYTDLSFKK
jgi:hypothetical protein